MKTRSDIINELKTITSQADQFSQGMPYQVPAGYFEGLASILLNRVNAVDELTTLSPLLSGISKKTPYQTPTGYFEQLPAARPQETGKVVKGSFSKRFYRNAAAAVVAGLLFLGTWVFVQNTNTSQPPTVANNTMLENELLKVGESEIMAYLDSTAIVGTVENNPSALITEDDIMLMLAEVPDEELKEYLEG